MGREIVWGALAAAALVAGCAESQPEPVYAAPTRAVVVERRTSPPPPPTRVEPRGPEVRRFALAYPTGDRETSTLLVEKFVPARVGVGEPYHYRIDVTNLTDTPLVNVVIDDRGRGMAISMGAERPGITAREPGRWVIDRLAPGQTRTIDVRAVSRSAGTGGSCLTVDYEPALCSQVAVVRPALEVTASAPQTSLACEAPRLDLAVTNTGSGIAHDVTIHERLPDGLVTASGDREIVLQIGDLPSGETARRSVPIRARRPGAYQLHAEVTSDLASARAAPVSIAFVQPELGVAVSGPPWQYVGQPTRYQVTVTNRSDVPARDVELMLDAQGAPGAGGPRSIGVLAPHQSRTIPVELDGRGDQVALEAVARGKCVPQVSDRVVTTLRGAASLRVGTVDTVDPIQIGETTTYEITVTNQGRTAADNVDVRAQVPDGLTVVDVDGPTRPQLAGDELSFGTVTIPAGETATWRVRARADRPGTMRWATEVDSPLLDRPVPDVEPTCVLQPAPQ